MILRGDIVQRLGPTGNSQQRAHWALDGLLTHYFSTHGWSRADSSLLSLGLDLELLDAATAAARALLLKNDAAIIVDMLNSSKVTGMSELGCDAVKIEL